MDRPNRETGRQPCTACKAQGKDTASLAGHFRGRGLCRYHWVQGVWGRGRIRQLIAEGSLADIYKGS